MLCRRTVRAPGSSHRGGRMPCWLLASAGSAVVRQNAWPCSPRPNADLVLTVLAPVLAGVAVRRGIWGPPPKSGFKKSADMSQPPSYSPSLVTLCHAGGDLGMRSIARASLLLSRSLLRPTSRFLVQGFGSVLHAETELGKGMLTDCQEKRYVRMKSPIRQSIFCFSAIDQW